MNTGSEGWWLWFVPLGGILSPLMGFFTMTKLHSLVPDHQVHLTRKYRVLLSVSYSVFLVFVQIGMVLLSSLLEIQIPLREVVCMVVLILVLWGAGLYLGLLLGVRFLRKGQ